MAKLTDLDPDRLRAALADATEPKAVKRLMVALAYLDDVPVSTLSERYDIPKSTIYYWLDRFENQSLSDALRDEDRPGRPSKLSADEQQLVESTLDDVPRDHGYDADVWTAEVLQRYIEREFGVTYSLGHTQRLLREFCDA